MATHLYKNLVLSRASQKYTYIYEAADVQGCHARQAIACMRNKLLNPCKNGISLVYNILVSFPPGIA